MANKEIYDLDGTLSRLNNTFDFILLFLKKRNPVRYILGWIAYFITDRIFILPWVFRRRIIIRILFYGIREEDLINFFESEYKEFFLKNLTELGKQLLKTKKSSRILLTGCTEIPARSIGKIFGLKAVISTEFKYKNKRIVGIRKDTFGNLKCKYVSWKEGDKITYYTDDLKTERKLKKTMDRIIVIK